LLTLQSNRFLDNSSVANVITANNGVVITPFSPFAPTSSYSAAAVGGSGYFDGSGDYLTTPTGQTPLTIGTSSFTISFWFYCPAQVQTNGTLFASNASVTYTNAILSQFSSTAATTLELAMGGSIIKTGIAVVPNQWNFVVIQRTAPSTMQMWVNGNEVTGVTASSANLTDNDWRVAYWFTGAHALTGYISNFRIVKGTALYSGSTITVPTAPLGSTGSDTSLLLNFTNAGVVDATAKNVLETEGNAQISTAQSKWGGGSIYLDGTSNTAVKLLASNQLSPFSGDYTYEFWLYFNSFTGTPVIFDTRASSGAIPGLQIFCTTSGVLTVYGGSATATLLITGGTLSTGQWYYIALVRSGSGSNNTKLYLNGSQSGSSATDTTNYNNQGGYIGANAGSPSNYLNGYIDDFRFTRYARTIATPTAPFPVQ
jgi:hypothetical protein